MKLSRKGYMPKSSNVRNFGKVFPARNLGSAEGWGRVAEDRIRDLENEVTQLRQSVLSSSRVNDSRSDAAAAQLRKLMDQQRVLDNSSGGFEGVASALSQARTRLDELSSNIYNIQGQVLSQFAMIETISQSVPKSFVETETVTGFPLTTTLSTVVSISVPVPEGMTFATVLLFVNSECKLDSTAPSPGFEPTRTVLEVQGVRGSETPGGMTPISGGVLSLGYSAFSETIPDLTGVTALSVSALMSGQYYDEFQAENTVSLTASVIFSGGV